MLSMNELIKILGLKPHPEGGYYKETYRSRGKIKGKCLGLKYSGERHYSTCIYFLMTSDNFSAFHRINQDEIWHFYDGASIRLHVISENGKHSDYIIGRDFAKGEVPQLVVTGGHWFAAEVMDQNSYALVGCTVSPGFNFEDFELADREQLISKFPEHEELITKFTNR